VTQVGSTSRVAVAATATATALVVGVVGVVLAVDDRRRTGSDITSPSPSGATSSATQLTPTPTPRVPQPPPLLLPNMRSLSASDLQIEGVGSTAGCASLPRWPMSDLGRSFCCRGVAAVVPQDSMRPSRCCIEMPTGTGNFSAPVTGREAGESPGACSAIQVTNIGTSTRWPPIR
jgi:hypothetical protein